mgnify:CR=1 FL=1
MYDSDFPGYATSGTDNNARVWGAGGVRASTTLQRVWDGVDSRLLDIHRLRHIVEPGITFMSAGTNVESSNLPIYDDEVENLLEERDDIAEVAVVGVDDVGRVLPSSVGSAAAVEAVSARTASGARRFINVHAS